MRLLIPFLLLTIGCQPGKEGNHNSWSEADRTLILHKLDSTIRIVIKGVSNLSDKQWDWQADSSSWSIGMVVEHLITHEELYHREVKVLTSLPQPEVMSAKFFASDLEILSYGEITPQNIGKSPTYLEPKGRWCIKKDAINTYLNTRTFLMEFVNNTDADLRKYYTSSGRGPTKYRDLHQLLLISVAHTSRHHKQILKIKSLEGFPKD